MLFSGILPRLRTLAGHESSGRPSRCAALCVCGSEMLAAVMVCSYDLRLPEGVGLLSHTLPCRNLRLSDFSSLPAHTITTAQFWSL